VGGAPTTSQDVAAQASAQHSRARGGGRNRVNPTIYSSNTNEEHKDAPSFIAVLASPNGAVIDVILLTSLVIIVADVNCKRCNGTGRANTANNESNVSHSTSCNKKTA
jgi:hypothetical protein